MLRSIVCVVVALITVWIFPPTPRLIASEGTGTIEIRLNPNQRFQWIDGFGLNFNGTYFRDAQKPMIKMLINDLGATIFRLDPYGLSNWEAVNDNDDPDDINWSYYDDRYSIPAFEASWAAARYLNRNGAQVFLTLSGTAPKWMMDNHAKPPTDHVCHQDAGFGPKWADHPVHLSSQMYKEFAEEVVSMAVYARRDAKIRFKYFSPLNETDCYPSEGPRVDPVEMPKVLDDIAALLQKEGLGDVRLVVADQANLANDYVDPILKDKTLMKQVGVFSFHSYNSASLIPQVDRIRASAYSWIPVWLTEFGSLNDLDKSEGNEWKSFCVAATQRALRALNQGAAAALYWDAFDNYHEHYPRMTFYGLMQNSDELYTPKKRYYAAKQLFHFVRPGSRRIGVLNDSSNMVISAFYNGTLSQFIVVGVKTGGPNQIRITLPESGSTPTSWSLYETTRRINCMKTDTLPVHNGTAEFNLRNDAIFTLVGKINKP